MLTTTLAVPGDSGAWIYNSSTLQLCGHVLAWSDKRKTAYIAPMEVLFDDIKKTLDAEDVSLPNPAEHAQGTARCAGSKLLPVALQDTPTPQPSQQLEVSREVERALLEMKVSDEASVTWTATAPNQSRLPKDVPDSVQAAVEMRNTSPGLADLARGVVG
jgi:hypothetical protein